MLQQVWRQHLVVVVAGIEGGSDGSLHRYVCWNGCPMQNVMSIYLRFHLHVHRLLGVSVCPHLASSQSYLLELEITFSSVPQASPCIKNSLHTFGEHYATTCGEDGILYR